MPNAPAAPADGQVVTQAGDLPAQMGSHGALHMNTPEPKASDAPKATDAPKASDAPQAGAPSGGELPPMPETGSEKF